MKLSVIIPMYNEADRIEIGVRAILEYIQSKYSGAEAILVDDGSQDDTVLKTQALLQSPQFKNVQLLRLKRNRGKGAAVREGMLKAKGEIRLFADADNATPIEEIARLLPMVETPQTIVIGSRGADSSLIEKRQPRWRQTMGKAFNLFPKLLLHLPYKDTQCGFKLFGKEAAEVCFGKQKLDRFAFDVELLWIAQQEHFPVKEVPVRWRHVARSRVNPLVDSYRMARDALKIRRLHVGR